MKFLPYEPDQAWLLPPSVKDVLGEAHLCFFVHRVVERLDLQRFEEGYGEEGRRAYAPALMVKVWLYAYALQVTSSRRLEQRVREDLALRYLAGGATPRLLDLERFPHPPCPGAQRSVCPGSGSGAGFGDGATGACGHRLHPGASQRFASPYRAAEELRQRLAKTRREIRRWQQQCDAADPNEEPGTKVPETSPAKLERQLQETQQKLAQLEELGARQISLTDPESRFLHEAGGFVLGYTAELAVSDDHLIVAQRITQATSDSDSLLPMIDRLTENCRESPAEVSADSGYFSVPNVVALEARAIKGFVPDAHLTAELRHRRKPLKCAGDSPEHVRMRERLRSSPGQARYRRRGALVEPVLGVLKEQRGLRRFRLRGLKKVAVEWALACTAFNLARMSHRVARR